jgi:predicted nucleic acid-binding protein
MIVVSNTTPINYLVLIDYQHVLPVLFDRIMVPSAVIVELRSPGAPQRLAEWLESAPDWLETREVSATPSELLRLGAGEREAIALAETVEASMVLLDEKKAREVAHGRGLRVSGTLGVLDLAARRGLIDLLNALGRLEQTTFRASPTLWRRLRQQHSART